MKADWHQWRGPALNGTAPDATPLLEWSGTKNVRWKLAIPGRGSATPVIAGDHLFLLTALDTGKKPEGDVTPARREGAPDTLHQFSQVYSSPVAANGHVYMTGREGTTVVIKDSPEFEAVSSNELGEPVDASLVFDGGDTYIRAAKHLYCIGADN